MLEVQGLSKKSSAKYNRLLCPYDGTFSLKWLKFSSLKITLLELIHITSNNKINLKNLTNPLKN